MLHRGAAPNGPESEAKKPPPFVAFPFYEYEQFAWMLVAFALNAVDVFSGHRSHPQTGLMKTRSHHMCNPGPRVDIKIRSRIGSRTPRHIIETPVHTV